MIDESRIRRRLEQEADACYQWSNQPDTVYSAHSHTYGKVLYCLRGSIRFQLTATGEKIDLGPGGRLDLPPNTFHSAVVGPDGVVCVEGQARAGRGHNEDLRG